MEIKLETMHSLRKRWDMYKEYFGEPGSELAEKLFHTSYAAKEKFKILD